MNKTRKRGIILLVMITILLFCPATTQAASKATKVLNVYEKILKSSSYDGINTTCFALLDINRDGIKELIISDAEKRFAVYSYNGSKAVRVYKYTVVNDHSSEDWYTTYYLDRQSYKQASMEEIDLDIAVGTSVYYLKNRKTLCIESYANDVGEWDLKNVYLTLSSKLKMTAHTVEEDAGDEICWVDGKYNPDGKKRYKFGNTMKEGTLVRFNSNTAANRKSCGIVAAKSSAKKDQNAKINKKSGKVYVGKSLTLKVSRNDSKVKWSTSNKKVATVSSSGVVKGKKAGKAVITATVGKKKLKCTVTVQSVIKSSVKKITVKKTNKLNITVNHPTTVCFKIRNTKYISARWENAGKNKLRLVITGKKKGSTYIKISNKYNKETISIKVKVTAVQKKGSSKGSGSASYNTGNPQVTITPTPVTPSIPEQPYIEETDFGKLTDDGVYFGSMLSGMQGYPQIVGDSFLGTLYRYEIQDGEINIYGSLNKYYNESQFDSSEEGYLKNGKRSVVCDEGTRYFTSGGTGAPKEYTQEEFFQIIQETKESGLGFIIKIQGGIAVSINICS